MCDLEQGLFHITTYRLLLSLGEVVRRGLYWAREGRKTLWVQSTRPKVVSVFTRVKHEHRADGAVIFALENVKLPWRGWR